MVCCIIGCPNNGSKGSSNISYHIFPHPLKDQYRHMQWIKSCNNPKVHAKDGLVVYKQYRICRRHFDVDCFNGDCRRLVNSAVPTLYLNLDMHKSKIRTSPDKSPIVEYLSDHGEDYEQLSEKPSILYDIDYVEDNVAVDEEYIINENMDIQHDDFVVEEEQYSNTGTFFLNFFF